MTSKKFQSFSKIIVFGQVNLRQISLAVTKITDQKPKNPKIAGKIEPKKPKIEQFRT